MPSLIPTESQEAKLLMQWAQIDPICKRYLVHIPNGGYRLGKEARRLKAEGVKSGVSDYFLSYPAQGYHGMWLELKRRKKDLARVSMEQSFWLSEVKSAGYQGIVAYGAAHAIEEINRYLGDTKLKTRYFL